MATVEEMPGSVASVFSEAEDFEGALRQEGWRNFLVAGRGAFWARLTQVALHRLQLLAGEERLARIAFMAVPADSVMVTFASSKSPTSSWSGIEMRNNEIMTIGAGALLHVRTDGASQWRTLRIRKRHLVDYGAAITGPQFYIPGGINRWQSCPAAVERLRGLYRVTIRSAEMRRGALADVAATHGLEQQLIHELVVCLSTASAVGEVPAALGHRDILARFEELLAARGLRPLSEVCAEIGVPGQLLRMCCQLCLGMTPSEYLRRHALQKVYRELRRGDAKTSTVAEIAKLHGFKNLSRFAANYRAIYAELPSTTLRSSYGVAPISLRGPHAPNRMHKIHKKRVDE
jgi:AraC-like DNA-binding protein